MWGFEVLRRASGIKLKEKDDQDEDAFRVDTAADVEMEPAPEAAQRVSRSGLDGLRTEAQRRAAIAESMSKLEKQPIDDLRSEFQRNLEQAKANHNVGGPTKAKQGWSLPIPPSRVALLAVALVAGGIAAYLALHRDDPAPAPAPEPAKAVEVKAPPAVQVLVAKAQIGIGQKLTADEMEWQTWPEAALRPEYITVSASPDAMKTFSGSVVRSEFIAGEPIRQQKLAAANGGYLSSILAEGMRGVSVPIAPDSASGGFVAPNDHVDVVLTRQSDLGQQSQTILQNVRIIAIDAKLGSSDAASASAEAPADSADAKVFSGNAIATLELDPTQAEVIINATTMGKLSLVLRSTSDLVSSADAAERAANAAIKLSSPFWAK